MNGYRESDSLIVSKKPSNKTGDNKPVAEKVEKRGLAEGNSVERNKGRSLTGEPCKLSLQEYGRACLPITLRVITQGRSPVH